jgi:predicted nucleotidyltransferase
MKKRVRQLLNSLIPYQPERMYLFGSWARGEEDELSDLDLLIIKETESPFFDRLREVYTPKEFARMRRDGNAFAEMILEEGALIYDRQAEN